MSDHDEIERPPAPPKAADLLAADSAANEALEIAKRPPPAAPTGPTLAVFMAATVVSVVGLATGLGVIAGLGVAGMAACIQRLNAANYPPRR